MKVVVGWGLSSRSAVDGSDLRSRLIVRVNRRTATRRGIDDATWLARLIRF